MSSIVQKIKSLVVLISLQLLAGGIGAWAQEPVNYSGTYYIKTSGKLGDKQPAGNYYLCPTEGWCYYKATNDFSSEDTGMPFLTSYQCLNSIYGYDDATEKAVWIVEKHPTEDYYYIKRASDGKYVVLSGQIRTTTNANRMRLHLEALTNPDDKALFAFSEYSDGLKIKPKTLTTYLTVNGSNFNTLMGEKGKGDGPTGYTNTAGIIGIFSTLDDNSKFYLESTVYIVPPTITNNNDGTFTITAPEGTIHYTTDGSNPTAESPECSEAFTPPTETEVIKAIAVVGENASGVKSMPLHTYTYYIINRAGDIAIKKEVKQGEGKSLSSIDDIPAAIRSSYLAEESASFYSFTGDYSADKLIDENKIYATPSADAPIYVTYTTDHLSEKFLRLRAARAFNIKNLSDQYAYDNGGTLAYEGTNNKQPNHLWNIGGTEDPYDVEIKNVGTSKYLVFSPAPTLALAATATTKFIIMAGSEPGDLTTYEQINLMAVTGTGSTDFSKAEVRVSPVDISVTYELIDRQKKLIATIENVESELKLPDEWISPLVSAYHFYKTASIVGDVYTLSDPITSTFDVESGDHIYVNYDVSDEIDLDGRNSLELEDKENKSYMLRYLDGESFYQEDGSDGIMTEKRKAVYPYNNGDVTLYVYGNERWDAQLAQGASTRSRWLWYIEPANNPASEAELDPYHVKVSSYQKHIFRNNDDVIIGEYPSYLRTYKPEGYAYAVTNVTNSNPLTNGGAEDVDTEHDYPDSSLATEYMIVGTMSKTRLVTLNPVDGERRTVNSFEQYWKNNPTVQGILSSGNKVTTEGRYVTLTSAQKSEIEAKGWHVYEKWALSAPWVSNSGGGVKKQYRKEEHASQTISMGSGNFVFEEVSLDPQVILLDQHGWEVVRVPLSKTDVLSNYNSPMVEQYQWYSTSVKVLGYHKYDVSGTPARTTTSLSDVSDIPEKAPDYYVTYTVKSRYANAYKGAAKAADTRASAYIIKQGGKYAKTSGSTIDKTDAPASMENVPQDMQWYLKPNFDIDKEMGYLYQGEKGAQDGAKTKDATEQDYYNDGKNGFDPYNVLIQNKEYDKRYFTTNSSALALRSGIWTGTSTQVILSNLNAKQHPTGYDQTTLNITNSTFMVVSDANGNMRLMPRFDNTKVTNNDGSDNPFRVLTEQAAAATAGDEGDGDQTLWLVLVPEVKEIYSSSEITEMNGHYILAADFSFESGFESLGTESAPFTGVIDGQLNIIRSPGKAIVAYASGAQICNLILDNASISGGDNVGAICNVADGSTRIYNCGVNGGEIGGTTNVGGIVGWLKGTSRVINCYSYANITSGTNRAGIVGNNKETSTQSSLTTMIMNCMFYGDISDGGTISPIYGGEEINNVAGGMNNYNYYRYGSRYSVEKQVGKYNRALAMEEKFINRFERYRLLLNSNKKLAAKYAGIEPNELAKWVLETADRTIAEPKPYPVLKKQNIYPSIINYDGENAPDSASVGRLNGGKLGKTLTVTIRTKSEKTTGGQTWPAASGSDVLTSSLTLIRTDKDTVRYNFNYDKVQLPYYNDIGTGNYTESRVVTGWKITDIEGGTTGTYTASDSWGGYNFADRKCTNKDLYSVSGRVFSQGAYWDVPEGVTAITIEPYWAKANYVSDGTYDVVYNDGYTKQDFTPFGTQYTNNSNIDIYGDGNNQKVYTSIGNAIGNFSKGTTVYDQAVVLVGNVHQYANPTNTDKAYTVMSIDMNHDNEPDYSYIFSHDNRQPIDPIRYDFLNIMGIAEAQIPKGAGKLRNVSIFNLKGWFEITNTCVVNFSQLEYDNNNKTAKSAAPLILLGGSFEQIASTQNSTDITHTQYIHVGSNAWFAKFGNGTHSDGSGFTPHIPISVTGGDYDEFYLSGTYRPDATQSSDNAECYISGGRFGEMAGASMEAIDGDVRWDINWADITNFYGGGVNAVNPITGDLRIDIANSYVNQYCGGPKFGDMTAEKTVTTNATDCVFGTYFGAGYGGNAYKRVKYKDVAETEPADHQGDYASERGKYYNGTTSSTTYGKKGKGVATDFDYEFFIWSTGQTGARFYVNFITFSLATTHSVISTLNNCKVTGNVYGGGSLGKVAGDVSTTLNNCKVNGNVFGAGYSASLPKIGVRNTPAFTKNPERNMNIGMFEPGEINTTTEYEWKHVDSMPTNGQAGMVSEDGKNYVYTDEDLTSLGTVTGKVTLNINGTTTVAESVYGGGEESAVNDDTEVNVTGGIIGTEGQGGATYGNVYGGGKGSDDDVNAGLVKGNTNVTISGTAETTKILHNVYGGGAFGSVGTFTYNPSTGTTTLADNTGMANVTITGGTFGSDGKNNGMVFGSSRGSEGDPESNPLVDKMAWVGNTNVVIGTTSAEDNTNPWIKGSVYGGGENGHNFKDALVTIHSGTIGIAEGSPITDDGGTPYDPSDDITYSGARYPSRGNVYGSGCGTDTYKKTVSEVEKTYFDFNAGIVRGNTTVQIDGGHVVHNVYGGGAMGSVGTFTLDENGKPTSCAEGTGTCTVTVSGGQIGVAGAKMDGYGKGGPDDYGHVFGAGRGEMHDPVQYPNLETCAYFNKAILNISGSAFLTGSAYGGSESGHVLGDTEVNIYGGQIGCGKNATEPYGAGVWVDGYVPSEDLECASWPYEAPYAPHDLYANATGDVDKYPSGKSTEGGRLEASDGHTYYGNVFGGGSGCVPYYDTTEGISKYLSTAGSVEGNTNVTISGGHILTNVYGGCEATNVKGSATITMTGGTVGVPRTFSQIVAHPVTCYVFGAGKGDQRIFFNKETNVDRATVSIEGGKVYGSVFGGGEDGHVFQNTTVTIGTDEGEGPTIGTLGTSYVDGNIFGGGRGFSGDALTAGNVGGSVELNIKSGKILGSVYGGGRLASVGYGLYLVDEEIEEGGEMIKPYGILRPDDKYDGSYPDPSTESASTYYSNGRGYITINISGGTIGNDNEYIYNPTAEQKAVIPNTTFDYQNHLQYTKGGNVFTGGMGRFYALDGTLLPLWPKLGKCKGTTLNMTGGTVKSSIYGGGEIGAVAENATVNIKGGTVGTKVVDSEAPTKYYYFGSVFGGGKGSVDDITYPEGTPEEEQIPISEAGTTGGNVAVNLNKDVASDAKGAIVHQVFGCNDMNGTPKGTVTVHVYSTQTPENANISTKPAKNSEKYDVEAVYGGGNLAAYIPTNDNSKASVTIDGCDLTSINTVYGGGNAASVPASEVIVTGTYEIGTIFGGGNGNDKLPSGEDNPGANVGYKADGTTTYGKGTTFVDLQGGLIHDAYGGSNAKGKIWKTASVSLNEAKDGESGEPCCPLVLDEVYGAGNEAYMEGGTSIDLVCISKLGTLYGGAKNADVNGNVVMNIQSGRFDRVFGGNNIGGNINGSIEVNIEETGCYPIIIGELYGGGNQAAYSIYGYNDDGTPKTEGENPSADPQVNLKAFTSIGAVYGGGYGTTATMVGSPTVSINEVVGTPTTYPTSGTDASTGGTFTETGYSGATGVVVDPETGHTVDIPAHVRGKIGAVGKVFGGGNAAPVLGNTTVNVGNLSTIDFESTTAVEALPVKGADIKGNIYGGGDAAEVTGNASVNVGKKKVENPEP